MKAFDIISYLATTKNDVNSPELTRKLALRQKTYWLFKHRVMKTMESSQNFPMEGKVDVDETYVGRQDTEAIGRNEGWKRLWLLLLNGKGKAFLTDTAALSRRMIKGPEKIYE